MDTVTTPPPPSYEATQAKFWADIEAMKKDPSTHVFHYTPAKTPEQVAQEEAQAKYWDDIRGMTEEEWQENTCMGRQNMMDSI
jgi:hypothetical protein